MDSIPHGDIELEADMLEELTALWLELSQEDLSLRSKELEEAA